VVEEEDEVADQGAEAEDPDEGAAVRENVKKVVRVRKSLMSPPLTHLSLLSQSLVATSTNRLSSIQRRKRHPRPVRSDVVHIGEVLNLLYV